jgi:hypothetical protein
MTIELLPVTETPEPIDGILVKLAGSLVYEKDGESVRSLLVKNLPEDATLRNIIDLLGIKEKRIGMVLVNGVWAELTDGLPQPGGKIFFSSPMDGG